MESTNTKEWKYVRCGRIPIISQDEWIPYGEVQYDKPLDIRMNINSFGVPKIIPSNEMKEYEFEFQLKHVFKEDSPFRKFKITVFFGGPYIDGYSLTRKTAMILISMNFPKPRDRNERDPNGSFAFLGKMNELRRFLDVHSVFLIKTLIESWDIPDHQWVITYDKALDYVVGSDKYLEAKNSIDEKCI